ncbi:MAG: HNH endonuclease [Phycisphaerae bacterium]
MRDGVCVLCGRVVGERYLTWHHVVPREEGGGAEDRVAMCKTCHKQVHAVYTNKELARELNTVEKLRGAEGLQGYLKWVRKQDAGAVFQVKAARRKRG